MKHDRRRLLLLVRDIFIVKGEAFILSVMRPHWRVKPDCTVFEFPDYTLASIVEQWGGCLIREDA